MRVIVMVAMEEEAQWFYPCLTNVVERPPIRGVVKTLRGELDGMKVDVVISGIGAVHASMAMTAALTATDDVGAVLSCGCSGAHLPEQRMDDIVIGSCVKPLSAEVIDREGKSRLAGVRCSMLDEATTTFEADGLLLRVATDAAKKVRDDIATEKATNKRIPRVDIGVVGSSDVWRQCPQHIERVQTAHDTLCEEMEAHALAQVCGVFGVPFIAIKDVANSEIHPEPVQLDPTHALVPDEVTVGNNAARVTARTLQLLSTDVEFAAKNMTNDATAPAATNMLGKRPLEGANDEPSAARARA